MHNLSRRTLLRATVAGASVAALGACTLTQAATITSTVVSDASIIAAGLKAELPAIEAIVGISDATVTTVTGYVDSLVTLAGEFSTDLTQAAAQPKAEQLSTLVSGIVSTLSGLTLPSAVKDALEAAQVLVPVIEVAVGLVTAKATPAAMTPDAARLILRAA